MEQPYRANVLIVKSVGMLPGASAENILLSMNVQHIKNRASSNFDTASPFIKNKKITHKIPGLLFTCHKRYGATGGGGRCRQG